MKTKFFLCFLGVILAGLLSTSPVAAFSFSSAGDLKNPGTSATFDGSGGGGPGSGGPGSGGPGSGGPGSGGHGSHAPIPGSFLLFGSGILGLVGISIRSRKRS